VPVGSDWRGAVPGNNSVLSMPVDVGGSGLVCGDQAGENGPESGMRVSRDVLVRPLDYLRW
jgi:hypothetical protein